MNAMNALTIDRDDDRVAYLTDPKGYGAHYIEFNPDHSYAVNVGVLLFLDDLTQVVVTIGKGPFSFQSGFTIAEARLLALALNTACDDAEAPKVVTA